MRAYSVDLRERIIEAVKCEGMSKEGAAERYKVSRASVYRFLELDKQGDLSPKVRPGQARRLDAELCQRLLGQLAEHNDATLEEHAELFREAHGVSLRKSSIGNYFSRLGVRRKKDLTGLRT
jgi:transposase